MDRGDYPMVVVNNSRGRGTISKAAIIALVCGITISLYVAWLYATHFYYKPPSYNLVVRNGTEELLRNVTFSLSPTGSDILGSLTPGQGDHHTDHPWPVPEAITLTFSDASDSQHKMSLKTGLAKSYRGEITVTIWKTNEKFSASLKSSPLVQ